MIENAGRLPVTISPSILTADFGRLAEAVLEVEAAGADSLHLDVMDGHFVPNITFGPLLVTALRAVTRLPFDVHLMIDNPEQYVEPFHDAGATRIIIHYEATTHVNRALEQIRGLGASPGIALNPLTPIIALDEIGQIVDYVLIMSVNPGFGGQSFIGTSPRKVRRTRRLMDRWDPSVSIGVDGGVDTRTAAEVVQAGADNLVAGSAVFNTSGSVAENIRKIRQHAVTPG